MYGLTDIMYAIHYIVSSANYMTMENPKSETRMTKKIDPRISTNLHQSERD
jgi:hypothetical protein